MDVKDFSQLIERDGWVAIPNVLNKDLLNQLQDSIDSSYSICREIQVKNKLPLTDGTIHHLLGQNNIYLEIFKDEIVLDYIDCFFSSKSIVNSYGGVINLPSKNSYVHAVHRDIRSFSEENVMLNMLVMIDDFTLENGATWFLTGSHKNPIKPTDESFFENADRSIGSAGTVVFFNSNLWHAAGTNNSENVRRALTLNFTKPFMKQQFDYPCALGYEFCENLSDRLKQLVGYFARVPSTLDEWYQLPEKRFYRPDQG
jgi:hypothetical protein